MAPFYIWGSTISRLEPLQRGSLLFTTNFYHKLFENLGSNYSTLYQCHIIELKLSEKPYIEEISFKSDSKKIKYYQISKKVVLTVRKKELFIVLPCLETLSSNLKQKLITCFQNSLPQCNIKIILQSTNRLSSLFRFEDVIPKELQSHLVYKFL